MCRKSSLVVRCKAFATLPLERVMELAALATKLWNEHDAVRANWMPIPLQIWLRDECKCVYCGFDLLGTRGVAYCFSSEDHLLPKSTYPELESRIDNRVLSCRVCNVVKGDHDVNRERPLYVPGEGAVILEGHWQEFRRRPGSYVSVKLTTPEQTFIRAKEIILSNLSAWPNDQGRTTNDVLSASGRRD